MMKRGALISVLAASSMTVMAGAAISPALPKIAARFSTTPNAALLVKLALTLPALCVVVGAPLAGLAVDRWQRKGVLLIAVLLYGVAGFSGFWATDLPFLLAGRIALGFAIAGLMTATTTLIGDYYQGAERSRYLSWQGAAMSFGGVVFVFLGGALAEISWRTPFMVYLTAFAPLPFIWLLVQEPAPASTKQENVTSATAANTALPWGLLLGLYAVIWLNQIIFYLIPVQLAFYLRDSFGAGALQAGAAMSLFNLCAALAALRYGWFKARLSFLVIFMLLFGIMGTGYLMIAQAASYGFLLAAMGYTGLGSGLLLPNLNVWLMSRTPEAWRGRVVSGVTTCLFLGQFMSPLVAQAHGTNLTTAETYALAGGLLLLLAIIFGGLALMSRRPVTAET